MAIDISEIRPSDYEQVLALWSDQEELSLPQQLIRQRSNLSVVAREAGRIVGAVLCGQVSEVFTHCVVIAPTHRDSPITRHLLDKALLKFLAHGDKHLCQIHLANATAPGGDFWDRVKWRPDEPEVPVGPGQDGPPI